MRRNAGSIRSAMRLPMVTVAVFVERPVVAEAREIKLQRFRFEQPALRRIVDDEMGEVGLAGDRAEAGEFWRGEAGGIERVAVRVRHALEQRICRRYGDRASACRAASASALLASSPPLRLLRRARALVAARSSIDAALMAAVAADLNLGKARQPVVQAVPQPHGDALERRRFKSLDVVEETMVERVARLGECSLDVVEMEKHAGRRHRARRRS